MHVPISSRKGWVKSKIKKLMNPSIALISSPYSQHPRYRRMENSIVSKVSLRTSQRREYNRIYVMINVWGSLGSIKSIHRVTVSTLLTSNAPSVVIVTVLSRTRTLKHKDDKDVTKKIEWEDNEWFYTCNIERVSQVTPIFDERNLFLEYKNELHFCTYLLISPIPNFSAKV